MQRWWRSRPWGGLAATFVVEYGTGRLLFDFFREDDRYLLLTASQWVSLAAIAAAVLWLAARAPCPGPEEAETRSEVESTPEEGALRPHAVSGHYGRTLLPSSPGRSVVTSPERTR
jgi:hypothetical protein